MLILVYPSVCIHATRLKLTQIYMKYMIILWFCDCGIFHRFFCAKKGENTFISILAYKDKHIVNSADFLLFGWTSSTTVKVMLYI